MSEHKHLLHPDVHMPASQWSEDQVLHVAAVYSNPFRWRTRRELANDFRRHMRQLPNVELHLVELAYGDRPWDLADPVLYPRDVALRTRHELFHKENLLNIGVQHFPPNWKYGAVVDADFHWSRYDIALETIHQLQHYDFVQMFSSYTDLSGEHYGHGHRPIGHNNGAAYNYVKNGMPEGFGQGGWATGASSDGGYGYGGKVGATGGAWAFRRSAFDTVGGMMDRCILGHGDWFMFFGLIGEEAPDMHSNQYNPEYLSYIHAWQQRAARLTKNIGYVDAHAIHHFHGPKHRRAYSSRDKILVKHQYSPVTDVHPDWQGVLQLTPAKPRLRDDIRRYFISRSEDVPHIPDDSE
jgi:hypothetical protein